MSQFNSNPHDDDVATLLRNAARTFVPSASLRQAQRDRLLKVVSETQVAPDRAAADEAATPARFRPVMLRRWRLAAVASIGVALAAGIVALVLWPAQVTLAQVKQAVNSAEWVHLTYEDGQELWVSPRHGIHAKVHAKTSPTYEGKGRTITFVDFQQGIQQWYSPIQDFIEEHPVPKQSEFASDAWDAIVGELERELNGTSKNSMRDVERHQEYADGKWLLRFDSYFRDALGQRLLVQQLWADPVSALPVRMRERLKLWERTSDDGPEFINGTYSFPSTGPASVYDLGVSRDLAIAKSDDGDGPVDPKVSEVLDAIRAARDRFPDKYRLVSWGVEDSSSVFLIYWSGETTLHVRPNRQSWVDTRGVKASRGNYFNLGKDRPEHYLPSDATPEQVVQWLATQTPVEHAVYDGDREFSQRGPFPKGFQDADKIHLSISRGSMPWYSKGSWSVGSFWPLADNAGDNSIRLLPKSEDTPLGTIGLRMALGDAERYDRYFDPQHDYICIKSTQWSKRGEEWVRASEETFDEFVQLATGHWVPTIDRKFLAGDPRHNIHSSKPTTRIYITPLTDEEFPADVFNGEKMLEQARQKNAIIETY